MAQIQFEEVESKFAKSRQSGKKGGDMGDDFSFPLQNFEDDLGALAEKTEGDFSYSEDGSDFSGEAQSASAPSISKNLSGDNYGAQVISALNKAGIAPTPAAYRVFYERLLDNKSAEFKQDALNGVKDLSPTEQQADIENKVNRIQKLLMLSHQTLDSVQKNMNLLGDILKRHKSELQTINTSAGFQNIMTVFEKELERLHANTKNSLLESAQVQKRVSQSLSELSNISICDEKYNIFNYSHLLSQIEREAQLAKSSKDYRSVLILTRIPKNLEKAINSPRIESIIMKSILKIVKKNIHKCDTLANCGKNVLGILIPFSDNAEGKKIAENICSLVSQTTIFAEETELNLSLCCGIFEINANSKVNEIEQNATNTLKKALSSPSRLAVFGE